MTYQEQTDAMKIFVSDIEITEDDVFGKDEYIRGEVYLFVRLLRELNDRLPFVADETFELGGDGDEGEGLAYLLEGLIRSGAVEIKLHSTLLEKGDI